MVEQARFEVVVGGDVESTDAPVAIHQCESRTVAQASIHAVELEPFEAKFVEPRHIAGEEEPARGVGFKELSVLGQDWRRVAGGVHGERYQLYLGCRCRGTLKAAHLVAHHRAWPIASGVNKI